MNHAEMRAEFESFSGRHNQPPAEVTKLLNNAIGYLSSRISGHFMTTLNITGLNEGTNVLDVSNYMLSVKNIWVVESSETYRELVIYYDLQEFLEHYPRLDTVYTPTACVKLPPLGMQSVGSVQSNLIPSEPFTSTHFSGEQRLVFWFNAISPVGGTRLRLYGERVIHKLDADTDTNILLQQAPELVNLAALWYLELRMRSYKEAQAVQAMLGNALSSYHTSSVMAEAAQMGSQIDG